jgi:hypothetical protein
VFQVLLLVAPAYLALVGVLLVAAAVLVELGYLAVVLLGVGR